MLHDSVHHLSADETCYLLAAGLSRLVFLLLILSAFSSGDIIWMLALQSGDNFMGLADDRLPLNNFTC